MKKIILFTILVSFFVIGANAQQKKTTPAKPPQKKTAVVKKDDPTDSLIRELESEVSSLRREVSALNQTLQKIVTYDSLNFMSSSDYQQIMDKPRFKIYSTDNMYILLKLDTRIGQVFEVQYEMNDAKPLTSRINWGIAGGENEYNGRFEMYPTRNKYTFIMVDTYTGYTYQVQWSIDDNHFVKRIY